MREMREKALKDIEENTDSTFKEQLREYTKGVTQEEQAEGYVEMTEQAKHLA